MQSSRASGGYTLGVDLGGTNLRVGAVSGEGHILSAVTMPTRLADGPGAVLRDIASAAAKLRDACAARGECAGAGVGSPGPIELPQGVLSDPSNLPGWAGLALKDELEKLLGLRVVVDSDANAAAWAEWRLGAWQQCGVRSLAMFTLGTGVGGGLVLNGELWHGDRGLAAEPGHTVAVPEGIACNCGSRGCLEKYASASAIVRMASACQEPRSALRGLGDKDISAAAVAACAEAGDAAAQRIFDQAGQALGAVLAMWVNALNLPLYTLGGGVAAAWRLFAPAMFRALRASSQIYRLTEPADTTVFEPGKTNVLPAQLGPNAGLLGAALLVD